DIRNLSGGGIDLVKSAGRVGVNLHGVDVAVASGLHTCRLVGLGHAVGRILWFRAQSLSAGNGLELAWKWKRLWDLHDLHRPRWFALEHCRFGFVVVANFGWPEGGAGRESDRGQQDYVQCVRAHQPSSFDQLMAWTNIPSGFLRKRSMSRGVLRIMVRIAVQRSVAASAVFSYRRSIHPTPKENTQAPIPLVP